LNSNGGIVWQKSYGGLLASGDDPKSIIQTSDGGFIFAGNTGDSFPNYHGQADAWVCKLNSNGAIQWQRCYGGSQMDYARSIVQTSDGGYIFAGLTNSDNGDVIGNHGSYDYWLVKLNATGTVQWSKCYGGSGWDDAQSIIQTTDNGYIVTGEEQSTDGDVTGNITGNETEWTVKLDNMGNIQWEKCYGGGITGTAGLSILQTLDGGYITGGGARYNGGDVTGNHGGADYWVVKITDTGNIQWQKCFGGSNDDYGFSIVKTIDGNYAIGGYSSSADGEVTGNHGLADYWVVKLDTNGNMLWEQSYGGNMQEVCLSMISTSDNGLAIIGMTAGNSDDVTGYHGGPFDYWVVKLNPDSTTGINEISNPDGVSIYPNPTSGTFTLSIRNYEYSPAQAGRNGEIRIYDVLGQEVYSQLITNNSTTISLPDISNGVYFYQLTNGKETYRGKFVKQ